MNIEPSLHPLEQISLDHHAWSFGCMIELCFLILCWGFLSLCLSEIFLVWFWYQNLVGLIKWVWQCSFLLLFEESEKVLPLNTITLGIGISTASAERSDRYSNQSAYSLQHFSLSLSFLHTQTHTLHSDISWMICWVLPERMWW